MLLQEPSKRYLSKEFYSSYIHNLLIANHYRQLFIAKTVGFLTDIMFKMAVLWASVLDYFTSADIEHLNYCQQMLHIYCFVLEL